MRLKIPLVLEWMLLRLRNYVKTSCAPRQLKKVADDPRELPEYQRQVEFLRENGISLPYECIQCREFDLETDRCFTEYMELYCGNKRGDRMCPGFNPPEEGRFEMVITSVEDLV